MPLDTQSLEAQFEKASKMKLGKALAEGNGTIYEIKGQSTKVVKVVFGGSERYTNKMIRLLKKLKRVKSPAVVRIYQYGKFYTDTESCYYYVMDKLRPLGGNRWSTGDQIEAYISGDPVPRNESGRIRSFVKKVRKLEQKHHYGDVHGGNIMISPRGAYKFVDLESFTYL